MTAPVVCGCLPETIDTQAGKVRASGVSVSEKTVGLAPGTR